METGWWMFATVLLGLTLVGIGYNKLVAWYQKEQPGYTAFFVVGGVAITLGGAALVIGLEAALKTAACFAASGLPMIVGSMLRNRDDGARARRLAGEWMDDEQAKGGRVHIPPGVGASGER